MPAYDWECSMCKAAREVIAPIADRNVPQTCECGSAMQRVITAPHAMPDIGGYIAMTGDKAGQPIEGRKQHREFLKRNRLVEVGNEPIRDTRQFRRVHQRGEIARALKDSIARICAPDLRRGGLKERGQ